MCWASVRHLPPSLQIRLKVPPPRQGGEGKGRAGVCQQISLDQNKLFQETAVNRTWVLGGVGWRWARPTLSGQRPHLPGSPLRGSRLEGEEQGGALGQHPDLRVSAQAPSLLTAMAASPPHLVLQSAQLCCLQTHTSPGKDPDFPGSPDKERRGWGGWYFPVTPRAGQGLCCSRHSVCQNSTRSPTGPAPVLWPRAPGPSPHRDPQRGRL